MLNGLLADCKTFEDLYNYACAKEQFLRQFRSLPAGIPAHDPRNRVFRHLDPAQREAYLLRWRAASVAQLAGRQLLVDGKQLRGPTLAGHQPAHNG